MKHIATLLSGFVTPFLLFAVMSFAAPAHAYRLISDPMPTNDPQYASVSHTQFYFDSAAPIKVVVNTTGGKHCEIDLNTVTLANGTHTAQCAWLIDHPTSPLESPRSNTVTFTWPIPNPPTGTLQAPAGWRLVP